MQTILGGTFCFFFGGGGHFTCVEDSSLSKKEVIIIVVIVIIAVTHYYFFNRVGVMGNPSDGFNGKTISLSIANFWAEVTIVESPKLRLIPHPLNDPTEFGSMADLYGISTKEGYLGGLRLLQATCKKFYGFCARRG